MEKEILYGLTIIVFRFFSGIIFEQATGQIHFHWSRNWCDGHDMTWHAMSCMISKKIWHDLIHTRACVVVIENRPNQVRTGMNPLESIRPNRINQEQSEVIKQPWFSVFHSFCWSGVLLEGRWNSTERDRAWPDILCLSLDLVIFFWWW